MIHKTDLPISGTGQVPDLSTRLSTAARDKYGKCIQQKKPVNEYIEAAIDPKTTHFEIRTNQKTR